MRVGDAHAASSVERRARSRCARAAPCRRCRAAARACRELGVGRARERLRPSPAARAAPPRRARARHGLCATPPSAIRTSRDARRPRRRAPRRPRRARTRTTPGRAPCGSASARASGERRQLDRDDQLARLEHRVALGLVAGQPVEVGERDRRARPPAPTTCTTASSAASATAMSDGCVATQCSRVRRGSRGCGARPRAPGSRCPARACCTASSRPGSTGSACAAAGSRRSSRRLRSWPDAPASSACGERRVARRGRARSAARSLLRTPAPIRRPPSSRLARSRSSGSRVTSTSTAGCSTPSRIRSTRFVPPPRNFAPGARDRRDRPRRRPSARS